MSSGNEKSILFDNIFALFYLYWNNNVDRMQQRLSEEEASKLQKRVYNKLSSIYQKNKWNLRELDWTLSVVNLGHIQNIFYKINI